MSLFKDLLNLLKNLFLLTNKKNPKEFRCGGIFQASQRYEIPSTTKVETWHAGYI